MPREIDFSELNQSREIDFNELVQQPDEQQPSNYAPVFMESMARRTVDALNPVNWPGYAGKVGANALAGATAAVRTPFSDQSFGQNFQSAMNTFPANVLASGPHVDSFDLEAGMRTVPEALRQTMGNVSLGDSLLQSQMELMRQQEIGDQPGIGDVFRQNREQSVAGAMDRFDTAPNAMEHGQLAGDVGAMAAMRSPFVAGARNARLASRAEIPQIPPTIEPGVKRFLDRKVGDYARGLKKGGLQIGETSLEGAWIAAINDEDPLSAAALSAGTQAGANLVRIPWDAMPELKGHPVASKGIKVAVLAASMGAIIQTFKEATPGGRDRILESEESGYKKAAIMIGLGIAANLAGFNRPNKMALDDLGSFADLPSTIKRSAVLSFMSDLTTDEKGFIEPVMNKMQTDPLFFAPHEQRRLERAFLDEDIKMSDVIDNLMETDRDFRMKMSRLREGL